MPNDAGTLGLRAVPRLSRVSATTYLDHAATTPVRPEVVAAVAEELARVGNPSSAHAAGRAARAVVEEAREAVAAAVGAAPSEVVLTSGGTEADNLAVLGAHRARHAQDPRRTRLVVGATEHHAVLDAVGHLVAGGAHVTWAEPDADGVVTAEAVAAALGDDASDVSLVSVQWAGNEVGVVHPLAAVVEAAHARGVPVHSDAVAAVGHVPVDVAASGVDLLSLTAHKLGGPVGTGALVARRGVPLAPVTFGGGQERRVRSGTLDRAGARGLALAVGAAVAGLETEGPRLVSLRDRVLEGALAADPTLTVTGLWEPGDGVRRLPGNAHLFVPGADVDVLLSLLDLAGVAVSAGSACTAGVARFSHVLEAMGFAAGSGAPLRVSLGWTTTEADVEAFLRALPDAVAGARRAVGVAS